RARGCRPPVQRYHHRERQRIADSSPRRRTRGGYVCGADHVEYGGRQTVRQARYSAAVGHEYCRDCRSRQRKARSDPAQFAAGRGCQDHCDKSIFINASVEALKDHLLYGSLLASLVVLLFIRNLRSVLIASLAIPTSVIATFTLLKAMNFTLNNMTLLGLTLAVGIVIDDAIVVLENIVRFIEEKSLSRELAFCPSRRRGR